MMGAEPQPHGGTIWQFEAPTFDRFDNFKQIEKMVEDTKKFNVEKFEIQGWCRSFRRGWAHLHSEKVLSLHNRIISLKFSKRI